MSVQSSRDGAYSGDQAALASAADAQAAFTGSKPVDPRYQLDLEKLSSFLRSHVVGFDADLVVEQFRGGQSNPTFLVRSSGQRCVVRRKPAGHLLRSAHAIDREYRVLKALCETGFPVPMPFAYCDDASIIGSEFYVMSFADGRVYWDPTLPTETPAGRQALYAEAARVIARLHDIDFRAAGLETYGKQGGYLARQIKRWTEQYRASQTDALEAMERLIDWLPKHLPSNDEVSVVHGDFRFDNLVFHPTEPRVIAVLDWELSTLGHPTSDFAYHCLKWHVPPGSTRGLAGLDLTDQGIPSEAQHVSAYNNERLRSEVLDWDFHIALNLFKVAAISQGVFRRGLDGNASNARALEAGTRVRTFAGIGWDIATGATSV
jgi:aminoglycoside phosphotransferase (APT) family kinase protein